MAVDPDGTKPKWWEWLLGVFIIVGFLALSVLTAGIGTAITGALGSGFIASIVGGVIGGAISGAVMSFGLSIATQGIANGFENINWKQVGKDVLIGAISGAIAGGIIGAAKFLMSAEKIAGAISGIQKAENGVVKASEILKNTPIAIKGGVVTTEHISAQLGLNVASQILSKAQSIYEVSTFIITQMYKFAQFGLKQLVKQFY